jgi:uncharacterized protein YkwD
MDQGLRPDAAFRFPGCRCIEALGEPSVLTRGAIVSGRISRTIACLAVAAAAAPAIAACNPLVQPGPVRGGSTPVSQPAPKPSPTTPAPTTDAAAYESRILVLVNAERARLGEHALTLVSCAQNFAGSWAQTMASTGNFWHQSLSPIMSACSARGAGENIAYGNVSADQMMTMWMNSPGHKANILNASYTGIGIGAVKTASGRWYGVQDFVTQ